MIKFCPFCKADCFESCGLYDFVNRQCVFISIAIELRKGKKW